MFSLDLDFILYLKNLQQFHLKQNHAHKINTSLSPDEFLDGFEFHHQNKLFDSPSFSRIHLLATKKRNLKQTAIPLNENINDVNNFLYTQWYLMSLELIDSKILKPLHTLQLRRNTT